MKLNSMHQKSKRLLEAEQAYQKFFEEQLVSFPDALKKEPLFIEAFKTFGELCYFRGATDAVQDDISTIIGAMAGVAVKPNAS